MHSQTGPGGHAGFLKTVFCLSHTKDRSPEAQLLFHVSEEARTPLEHTFQTLSHTGLSS